MFWKGQTSSKSVAQPKPSLTSRRNPTPPLLPPPPPPSSKGSANPDLNRIRKRSLVPGTTPINDFGEEEYHHQDDTPWARTPFSMGDLREGGDRKFLETPKTPFAESSTTSHTFTHTLSTPSSQSTSSTNSEAERQRLVETKETEGLGVVDRKANDSTDMKRGGRRIPHSDLQLKDFSLESLTNFPENLRRFEREHGAAWDRDFFDKNIRFALMSRWLA